MSVPPLLARVEPIAGESLLSLVARAAHANVMPKLAGVLANAGVGGHPAFAPFTAAHQAQPLAELLGVPVAEVESRLHPLHPDQSQPDARVWAGLRMRRRSIEARERRIAPLALKCSVHHRLEWTHRSLSFCPETLQQLISDCPACGAKLGWVTTKGLDRCERCEASLLDASAPLIPTRSPDRLRAAAGLISPDLNVRAAAQAQLSPEFLAWDAGDLFAALCELGYAWRHAAAHGDHVLGRALADGSHRFEPEDLARGHALLADWPERRCELLRRLADTTSGHRASGRLTRTHLGVLGRHVSPVATGPTLGGLLTRAIEAEAEERRMELRRAQRARINRRAELATSVTLGEASRTFEISALFLKRLIPDGASFVAARARRQGGVRFRSQELADTVVAYNSAESFADAARRLGAPRYVLPALVEAGVLEACPDPDVPLMMADGAVTARSMAELERTLEMQPASRPGLGLRSLAACLRRRFDPQVWAAVLKAVRDDPLVHRLTLARAEGDERPPLDRVYVSSFVLAALSPKVESADVAPLGMRLTAGEVGRLLSLSPPHLPELVSAGLLAGAKGGRHWSFALEDVVAFHRDYVTAVELKQRLASFLDGLTVDPTAWDEEPEAPVKLRDLAPIVSTRHFTLCRRVHLEESLEWPDPMLN